MRSGVARARAYGFFASIRWKSSGFLLGRDFRATHFSFAAMASGSISGEIGSRGRLQMVCGTAFSIAAVGAGSLLGAAWRGL